MNIIINDNNEIVGYGDFETSMNYPQYEGEVPKIIMTHDKLPLYKFINGEIIEIQENILSERKYNINNIVTAERDKRINKGFTYNMKQIACDIISQANANAYLTADPLGLVTYPIKWRTIDNSIIEITDSAELKSFASTMLEYVQGQFQDSWTVKDNIENATTVEEIETIYGGYING